MTTKTIPAYLEDERKKDKDAQQRIQEEAARIQPLHHGHHRAAKAQAGIAVCGQSCAQSGKHCVIGPEKASYRAKEDDESSQGGVTPKAGVGGKEWEGDGSRVVLGRHAFYEAICGELIELNAESGAEWKIQTLTKTLA